MGHAGGSVRHFVLFFNIDATGSRNRLLTRLISRLGVALAGSPIKTERRKGKIDLFGSIRGSSPFGEDVACVASVSMRFRSKERGTRVKDRAKNGSRSISRATKIENHVPWSFLNPKETLATRATCLVSDVIAHFRRFATESRLVFRRLLFQNVLRGEGGWVGKGQEQTTIAARKRSLRH